MVADHELWGKLPSPLSFSLDSVCDFTKYVLEILNHFRYYDVCVGNPETSFYKAASKIEGTQFDCNIFYESRYTSTFRSVNCRVLLPVQKKQCLACGSLRNAIKRRLRRVSSTGSPHLNMNNRFMNTPQTKKKLVKERKEKRNALARAVYHKRARDLIKDEAVEVDESMNDDLQEILNGYEKLNKLQKIFFLEQMKVAQAKGARGRRWHPLMIRVALAVRMASPKAYKVLADWTEGNPQV